ncbi:hypothetical protein ROJ8625_03971 [Roseivivax jejudonensis]|uniref:TadE-like protein n=1 Tax=Roseivivax jejudonensis TaxID=1529041 RepID=A0A1X7A9Y9_9RHOB|nr:pilus assembly protein [Roseivivax jejudonensis]SLN73710.1 hypothetical protein ROJ8625_03971 [Roseivivax jejudonensis]
MTRKAFTFLRGFARNESASMAIAAAIWIPAYLFLIISSVELGMWTARHTMLEHGLDTTVRDVRLGTGTIYDRDSLRDTICERAIILPNCQQNLMLEMVRLDIRNFTPPSSDYACADVSTYGAGDEVRPAVAFQYGRENELMLLRACFQYEPVSPGFGLAEYLQTDGAGLLDLKSQAAFVHEPL